MFALLGVDNPPWYGPTRWTGTITVPNRYFYNGLPTRNGYAFTYNSQRGTPPSNGSYGKALTILPLGETPLIFDRTKPTHRIRVRFSGPPSQTVPISGQQQNEAAAEVERQSNGKVTVFYNANSPVLTANLPTGWKAGQPLIYYYEVDVAVDPSVNIGRLGNSIKRILEEKQSFFSAGLQLIDVIFSAIGQAGGAAATSLLKHLWKPALIVAGVYVGIKLLPSVIKLADKKMTAA